MIVALCRSSFKARIRSTAKAQSPKPAPRNRRAALPRRLQEASQLTAGFFTTEGRHKPG